MTATARLVAGSRSSISAATRRRSIILSLPLSVRALMSRRNSSALQIVRRSGRAGTETRLIACRRQTLHDGRPAGWLVCRAVYCPVSSVQRLMNK